MCSRRHPLSLSTRGSNPRSQRKSSKKRGDRSRTQGERSTRQVRLKTQWFAATRREEEPAAPRHTNLGACSVLADDGSRGRHVQCSLAPRQRPRPSGHAPTRVPRPSSRSSRQRSTGSSSSIQIPAPRGGGKKRLLPRRTTEPSTSTPRRDERGAPRPTGK